MVKLKGLATGIGSLPHKDAEAALDLIFKYLAQIPFWPQLPRRDVREGMIAQFSESLPCLKVSREGVFFSSLHNKEKELEVFYERIIAQDLDYFKISPDFAQGLYRFYERLSSLDTKGIEFIKCQITGPFTFAASIKDDSGKALLHDSVFMQAILKGLGMKALWQIEFFQKFGRPMIMFLDEPYLGCFGSAYTPINREEVVKGLGELAGQIKTTKALVGVHCCGNTDWSIFTQVEGIDIINFDAFGFLDRLVLYASELKGFLERGGIICWGIVPTQEFSGQEKAEGLLKKLEEGLDLLENKGIERNLLLDNLLLSPACGLGTLDTRKSEEIFKVLADLAVSLRKIN